jgi:hypothetical protein
MRLFLPALLLSACGNPAAIDNAILVETSPLRDTFTAISLEPLVSLVEQPLSLIETQADCPRITVLPSAENTTHERWQGGCTLADGALVHGELEHFIGPGTEWIAGRDFRIEHGDTLRFGIDGAIEITAADALWLVDAAVALCGTHAWPCDDGVLGLDLAYTIYPAATFPNDYDTTVSGVVATETRTSTLDGAWSVDTQRCAAEPVSGLLSINQGAHHAMTLDGADACDGCAALQVQGLSVPDLCGLNP